MAQRRLYSTLNSYRIARAGWTPDSHNVWVARLNRVQNQLVMLLFYLSLELQDRSY